MRHTKTRLLLGTWLYAVHASAAPQHGNPPKTVLESGRSSYAAALTARIYFNTSYSGNRDSIAGNPRATFRVEQLPSGEVTAIVLIESSGIPEFDGAVERAIAKSSPLPKKSDGTVEPAFTVSVSMKDEQPAK